jgi:hypothetical protein
MTQYTLTLADCAKINIVVPPVAGVAIGGGIHVDIPPDWAAKIASGVPVPGCSFVLPDAGGNVDVDEGLLSKLNASGKPEAAAISAKIAIATPVVDEDVAISAKIAIATPVVDAVIE